MFGLGLLISGMADPAKVQNFLDLFGTWDPSLAFVMAGAVATAFVGYRVAFRRPCAAAVAAIRAAGERAVDRRLLSGPACSASAGDFTGSVPGRPLVSIPLLAQGTMFFVPAMLGRHRARARPAHAAVRTGGAARRSLKIIGKVQCSAESAGYRRALISAENRISTSRISSLPNLSHPA